MSYLLSAAAYLDPQRARDLGGICTSESASSLHALDRMNAESDARDLRQSNQDHADMKTRAARAEIAKLAQYMSAPQVIALLSSLVTAFGASHELRTSASAQSALEYVLDAVGVLEDAESA